MRAKKNLATPRPALTAHQRRREELLAILFFLLVFGAFVAFVTSELIAYWNS